MRSSQPLPNYIRAYRKRSGLSQEEFAFAADMSDKSELCDLERFHRGPSYWTAACCAQALGIGTDELFRGIHESAGRQTTRRMRQLQRRLVAQQKDDSCFRSRIAQKIGWLCQRLGAMALKTSIP